MNMMLNQGQNEAFGAARSPAESSETLHGRSTSPEFDKENTRHRDSYILSVCVDSGEKRNCAFLSETTSLPDYGDTVNNEEKDRFIKYLSGQLV